MTAEWFPTTPRGKAGLALGFAHADQRPSYLDMKYLTAMFELTGGWYETNGEYRRTAPDASENLYRPASAQELVIECMVPPGQIELAGKVTLHVVLNGRPLEARQLTREGVQAIRWILPGAPAAMNRVEIHVTPDYLPLPDPRALGLYVSSFGFLPR